MKEIFLSISFLSIYKNSESHKEWSAYKILNFVSFILFVTTRVENLISLGSKIQNVCVDTHSTPKSDDIVEIMFGFLWLSGLFNPFITEWNVPPISIWWTL